jgi:hypothetical protein
MINGKPEFERTADTTLDRARPIYAGRGEQYGDTWDLPNQRFAVMTATLGKFGVTLTPEQMRLLKLASLIDTKDDRLIGAWNPDSMIDGINYRASFCQFMEEYVAKEKAPAG